MRSDLYKIKLINNRTNKITEVKRKGKIERRGNLYIRKRYRGREGQWSVIHRYTDSAIIKPFLRLTLSQARRVCQNIGHWQCWKRKSVKGVRDGLTEAQRRKILKQVELI